MNSTDVINLFLLYQDYNLVYVNPFHELMKKKLQNSLVSKRELKKKY